MLALHQIVLLDEATSSVDFATDQRMQQAIRDCFQNCTILTIAHRLNTIIHSDKVQAFSSVVSSEFTLSGGQIIVMADGQVAEIGHPHELLQNPGSVFSGLVAEMGPDMEQTLVLCSALAR